MKKVNYCLYCVLFIIITPYIVAFSENSTSLSSKKQSVETEIIDMLSTISDTQNKVTALQELLNEEQNQYAKNNARLDQLTTQIESGHKQSEKRLLYYQLEDADLSFLSILLSSNDIFEIIEKMSILSDIQSAVNEEMLLLKRQQDELHHLKQQQMMKVDNIKQQKENLLSHLSQFEERKNTLQQMLINNRDYLDELSRKQYEKQLALTEKLANKEIAQTTSSQEINEKSEESTKESTTTVVANGSTQTADKKLKGSFPVVATAYSYTEPGLSFYTAMGIDLRINPRVIAVDKNVIPLGSYVEVEGYGVYIAGDTGGAIKGNKIDIHVNSVEEAIQFGRRTVNIRIIEKP